jgi:hypothetical protein
MVTKEKKKERKSSARLWYDRRGDNEEVPFDLSTHYVPTHQSPTPNIKRSIVWLP